MKNQNQDSLETALKFMARRAVPDRNSIPSVSLMGAAGNTHSLSSIRAANGIKRGSKRSIVPAGRSVGSSTYVSSIQI